VASVDHTYEATAVDFPMAGLSNPFLEAILERQCENDEEAFFLRRFGSAGRLEIRCE